MKSLGIFAVDECMVSLNECDRTVFSRFVILAIKEDLCAQNMAVLLGRNKDSFLLSFLAPMPKGLDSGLTTLSKYLEGTFFEGSDLCRS